MVRKWPVLHKQEIKVICLQSRSFTFWNVFVITVILKVNVLHLWFVSHFSCFTAAPWLVFCRHFSVKYRRLWQSTCNQSKWCEIYTANQWINISVCELLWHKTSDLSKRSTLHEANLVFLCYVYLHVVLLNILVLKGLWESPPAPQIFSLGQLWALTDLSETHVKVWESVMVDLGLVCRGK